MQSPEGTQERACGFITAELDELGVKCSHLEDAVSELIENIIPICLPEPPSDPTKKESGLSHDPSQVANALMAANERIRKATVRLNEISARIDF